MMSLKFEHPAWFIAIALVPVFITGALLTRRLRRKQWGAFVSARLRPLLLRRSSPLPRWLSFGFLMAAIVLLAFTLARPQTTEGTQSEKSRGRNVMIVLDLSRSMLAKDLKPDRLTQAKALCNELIEALPADRIGLVGFAGEPYLFAPLTVDHAAVLETVNQVDIDNISVQGSNLSSALKMAIKELKKTGQKENALILLTDGEETTEKITSIAEDARSAGLFVFTVAFGTEQGDFIPDAKSPDGHHHDRSGRAVITKLSTDSLRLLTAETGGRFVLATTAADIPDMVLSAIKDMEQFETSGREMVVPMEHYQIFLLPAILLLIGSAIAGTRWRPLARPKMAPAASAATAATVALLMLAPAPAKAGIDDQALMLLKSGHNKEAQDVYDSLAKKMPGSPDSYRFRLAQGTAAYRAGDLMGARAAFSEALRSNDLKVKAAAHHGLGNVLFENGWRGLSEDSPYPQTEPPQKPDVGFHNSIFDQAIDSLLGRQAPGADEHDESDPMAPFDKMIGKRMSEWLKEEVEEGDTAKMCKVFDATLTDWIDAVKHYDSAIGYDPTFEAARSNRALTVKYLKRIRETMQQVQDGAKMMEGNSGSGEGEEGDQPGGGGQGDKEGQGGGNQHQRRKGKHGKEHDKKGQEGPDGEKPDKDKGSGDQGEKDKGGNKPQKNESPEDTARRILKENADFEKGAPRNSHLDYEQPDRDW